MADIQKISEELTNLSLDIKQTVGVGDVENICEEIFDWVAGVELARLAAEDVIDAYWDDDKNGMSFKMKKQL